MYGNGVVIGIASTTPNHRTLIRKAHQLALSEYYVGAVGAMNHPERGRVTVAKRSLIIGKWDLDSAWFSFPKQTLSACLLTTQQCKNQIKTQNTTGKSLPNIGPSLNCPLSIVHCPLSIVHSALDCRKGYLALHRDVDSDSKAYE